MKQFIKEFAFAKQCDGILYFDVNENFYVCICYPLPIVPDRLEFVISFKN